MNSIKVRALALSMLFMAATVLSLSAISENVSAASVDGSWTSRVSGKGYTQTFLDPYGSTVTRYYDADLSLSSSGTSVTGTLSADSRTFEVWGTFDGSVFMMTLQWGWDGVSYCEATYALTVDGDLMYGGGSYLNVGVTINGYFDLKQGGLVSVGGVATVVSGVSISIAIVAVIIAVTPAVAPAAGGASRAGGAMNAGFRPQTARMPPAAPPYTPTQQWTTDTPDQPMSGDGTVPQGGVGLHYAAPPPGGRPAPPREHFNQSQVHPRCPIHGDTALVPHYSNTDMNDPGSWFCPRCNGYPWGKN
ncbi:MAG: hypothetical protein AB7S97_02005 [Thermoplasmata archaeon]